MLDNIDLEHSGEAFMSEKKKTDNLLPFPTRGQRIDGRILDLVRYSVCKENFNGSVHHNQAANSL